tara:strand:+ start:265 stop:507 length:243 start_codon:yes stop_codon:yes gene_type:complete
MPDLYAEMKARDGRSQIYLIDSILESMPDEDKDGVIAALEDKGIPHVAIADVLTAHGHKCSAGAVRNYRQGKLMHKKRVR